MAHSPHGGEGWELALDRLLGVQSPTAYAAAVDVHVLLLRETRVLLARRANTGDCDGHWAVPGGRLRAWESVTQRAVREARRRLGVRVAEEDLEFAHVTHHRGAGDRLGFFFAARTWNGEPANAQPHEHDTVGWFPLDELPEDLVGYSAVGLRHYRDRRPFSLHNWRPA